MTRKRLANLLESALFYLASGNIDGAWNDLLRLRDALNRRRKS